MGIVGKSDKFVNFLFGLLNDDVNVHTASEFLYNLYGFEKNRYAMSCVKVNQQDWQNKTYSFLKTVSNKSMTYRFLKRKYRLSNL